MAVLPRPQARHVRRPGEAIAIVDLDDGGRRESRRRGRVAGVYAGASVLLVLAFVAALRASPVPARQAAAPAPTGAASATAAAAAYTPVPIGWWTYLPGQRPLELPGGTNGVDLAAIPDRLLNDQPAARLRVAIHVRATSGLASVDTPIEISWTEAGYWYWMRSSDLSLAQLIDLASALR